MLNGYRKVMDGQVFFGTKKNSAPDSLGHKTVLNDFVIPTPTPATKDIKVATKATVQ